MQTLLAFGYAALRVQSVDVIIIAVFHHCTARLFVTGDLLLICIYYSEL